MFSSKQSYGRDAAAAIGGLALGIIGSRLLPPLLARTNGSLQTRLGGDPFDRLKRDHREILATLDKMGEAVESSLVVRIALLARLKRLLGKHATAEEDVVYPILHDQAEAEEASRRLYAEHAEMKIHLYHLEDSISDPAMWKTQVGALRELIAGHIRDEEETEFPRLRNLLTAARQRVLSGKIRREEALVL